MPRINYLTLGRQNCHFLLGDTIDGRDTINGGAILAKSF